MLFSVVLCGLSSTHVLPQHGAAQRMCLDLARGLFRNKALHKGEGNEDRSSLHTPPLIVCFGVLARGVLPEFDGKSSGCLEVTLHVCTRILSVD